MLFACKSSLQELSHFYFIFFLYFSLLSKASKTYLAALKKMVKSLFEICFLFFFCCCCCFYCWENNIVVLFLWIFGLNFVFLGFCIFFECWSIAIFIYFFEKFCIVTRDTFIRKYIQLENPFNVMIYDREILLPKEFPIIFHKYNLSTILTIF